MPDMMKKIEKDLEIKENEKKLMGKGLSDILGKEADFICDGIERFKKYYNSFLDGEIPYELNDNKVEDQAEVGGRIRDIFTEKLKIPISSFIPLALTDDKVLS